MYSPVFLGPNSEDGIKIMIHSNKIYAIKTISLKDKNPQQAYSNSQP